MPITATDSTRSSPLSSQFGQRRYKTKMLEPSHPFASMFLCLCVRVKNDVVSRLQLMGTGIRRKMAKSERWVNVGRTSKPEGLPRKLTASNDAQSRKYRTTVDQNILNTGFGYQYRSNRSKIVHTRSIIEGDGRRQLSPGKNINSVSFSLGQFGATKYLKSQKCNSQRFSLPLLLLRPFKPLTTPPPPATRLVLCNLETLLLARVWPLPEPLRSCCKQDS